MTLAFLPMLITALSPQPRCKRLHPYQIVVGASRGFSSGLCPLLKVGADTVGKRRGRNSNSMAGVYGVRTVGHSWAWPVFICHVALKSCALGLIFPPFQMRSQRLYFKYLLIPQNIILHFLCIRHSARCWIYSNKRERCWFCPYRAYSL